MTEEITEVTEAVVIMTLREVAQLLNELTPVGSFLDLVIEVGPVVHATDIDALEDAHGAFERAVALIRDARKRAEVG